MSEVEMKQLGPDTWRFGPKFRPTRFAVLKFYSWGGDWRFADACGHTIGPIYATKAELLADVDRFYAERWATS